MLDPQTGISIALQRGQGPVSVPGLILSSHAGRWPKTMVVENPTLVEAGARPLAFAVTLSRGATMMIMLAVSNVVYLVAGGAALALLITAMLVLMRAKKREGK